MRPSRQLFLLAAMLLSGRLPLRAQEGAAQKPNVILVLVDDLGWADLGCQGSRFYLTPNIDRLAKEGMRFSNAYAACAVCSPTRAAVLTGRSPARTGVTDWIRARFQRGPRKARRAPKSYVGGARHKLLCPPNPFGLPLAERSLAEVFSAAGYATAHIGKWHLGDDAWYPTKQGFDENHGGCDFGQPPSYFDPYGNRRVPGIPTLKPRRKGEYLSDREAAEAVSFIERHADRPFFLYLAHYAVHAPIQADTARKARFENRKKDHQKNVSYAAMVASVDDALGRVVKALEAKGLRGRTLILFTSDNGGLIGPTSNRPLRSGKGYPYEGGLRVPFIASWPGIIPPGTHSDTPVTSVDLFPTALKFAGVTVPRDRALDGVSLEAHLRSGGQRPIQPRALFWHFPHYRGSDVTPYGVVRRGRWKLIKRYEGPSFELFDLDDDPGEKKECSKSHPALVSQLDALLMQQLRASAAKLPRPNANYRPLPRVLLLGDSISLGYTAGVRRLLKDKAEVFRATNPTGRPENCAGTTRGIKSVERWLSAHGEAPWDVIHFNFGLHDLKRSGRAAPSASLAAAGPRQAEPDVYERQLTHIVERLQASGATLIFATTTPVPAGAKPPRDPGDPQRYNAIARRIMKGRDITVNDLYAFAAPRIKKLQRPHNVHFTKRGSQRLAEVVADRIARALSERSRK